MPRKNELRARDLASTYLDSSHSDFDLLGLALNASIHEAGHIVAAKSLNLGYGTVSIESTDLYIGYAQTSGPEETRRLWRANGIFRPHHYAADACTIVSMAGVVAEQLIIGHDIGGHSGDLDDIARFGARETRIAHLVRATWALVTRHRGKIELLADMLRIYKTLDAEAIDIICEIAAT
jgi:hypothetical protein